MWLLPLFSLVGKVAARGYYRLRLVGGEVPHEGPVLLVANHPNSLLDPALVVGAASRPVRFLARATLWSEKQVAWLVRASGAIPVYRRSDDPTLMGRNEDAFRAVHAALASGSAVGIFPEGFSHDEPGLAPLRTGAARIALGAVESVGGAFPIVPVGLVFRSKNVFRSNALIVIGRPVEWHDLARKIRGRSASAVAAGPGTVPGRRDSGLSQEAAWGGGYDLDPECVRELTDRIFRALRRVTVDLAEWEDGPLVESALDVWESEYGVTHGATRIERLGVSTALLRRMRSEGVPVLEDLLRDLRAHVNRLERLRLTPRTLSLDPRATSAIRWSVRRLALVSLPAVSVAVVGWVFFWTPYWLTGLGVLRLNPKRDQLSTQKLTLGVVVYGTWIVTFAVAAFLIHPAAGVAFLVLAPLVGFVGLHVRERWRGAWRDARRFLVVRSRRPLVAALVQRQKELARRLDEQYRALSSEAKAPLPDAPDPA